MEQPKKIEDDREKILACGGKIDKALERKSTSCISKDFGECNKCENFWYTEYELESYKAFCTRYADMGGRLIVRSHTKRIIRCTSFSATGAMSLWDMQGMAWDISGVSKEIKGFSK